MRLLPLARGILVALAAIGAWMLVAGDVLATASLAAWGLLIGGLLRHSRGDDAGPPATLAVLVGAAVLAHFASKASGLYHWEEWDTFQHFTLPLVLGLVAFALARHALPPSGAAVAAFLVVVASATLWEIYEFALDQLLGGDAQESLLDTMVDLVAGTLAGIAAAMTGWALDRSGFLRALRRDAEPLARALRSGEDA